MFSQINILLKRIIRYSILSVTLIFNAVATADDRAIIVFDASGSMWGQLEGKTKIEIAKDTVSDVVTNWDDSKLLGLMAYGHRKKGDCKDIETLIPVTKVDKAGIISQVKKINPKGKTPISASIRMAAEELKFTEDEATVILISDGKESCKADPCATADELEKLGVNFTAHVVGFGVDEKTSKQLKCIADNTGGNYFNADNAKQLNDALQQVVKKPKQLTIKAVNADTGKPFKEVIKWNLINQESEEVIQLSRVAVGGKITIVSESDTEISTDKTITPGNWLVSGSTGLYSGQKSTVVTVDDDQTVTVEMKKLLPVVTILAADEAIIGTALNISWEAEKPLIGTINLQLAGSKHNQYTKPSVYTKNKKEAEMRLPGEAGEYVLRYFESADRKTVITEHPIILKPADIKIIAADEIGTGSELDLSWEAPKTSKAVINLQLADDKPNYHSRPYFYIQNKKDNEAVMRMPSKEGDYVLRYYNQSDQTLMAERPIKLVPETITITAPVEIGTGTELDLTWEAPKSAQAVINMQLADEKPNFHSRPYFYVQNKKNNEATMRMPSQEGEYILRYYNQSDQSVMAERPIKLVAEKITIEAPDEIGTGTELDLTWDAPKSAQAVINLQLAEEKPNYNSRPYFYVQNKKNNEATMRMPSQEGDYVLRYYNQSDQSMMAEQPIRLVAETIVIDAPNEASAGTVIDLTWDAPKSAQAVINLQLAGEKPNFNSRPYFYVQNKKDGTANMRMPSVEGDYVLRYYNQSDRKVMAESEISIKSVSVKIDAPEEAVAGTVIDLSWEAPKGLDSLINIHPADEKPNYNARPYIYTKKKDSDVLRMPSVAGDYILRWFNRNDRKIMHERPIKITEATIVINAPEEATAGTEIELNWEAPKDLDSFINIHPADKNPNYNAKPYVYTKKKDSAFLRMPSISGEYTLRWFNRNDREILYERAIKIIAAEINIDVPDEIKVNSEIEISWQAPKGLNSFINIQKIGEKPSFNAKPYVYTKKKTADYLKMPSETGDYVLRWYNRHDRKIVAEKEISIISE